MTKNPLSTPELTEKQRQDLREQVSRAAAALWRSWPMRTFAYRNPLQGFEDLPFFEALSEGRKLLGVGGYLPPDRYRDLYRAGRISDEAIRHALKKIRRPPASLSLGERAIDPVEVLRVHLLWGIKGLEANIFEWKAENEDILMQYRDGVPSQRRGRPEGAGLLALWAAILGRISDGGTPSGPPSGGEFPGKSPRGNPAQIGKNGTLGEGIDGLSGSDLIPTLNREMIPWLAAFLDEGLSSYGMPFRERGFYTAWRELASEDRTPWFLGIGDFAGKVRDLPDAPEDSLLHSLDRLGIPEESREDYLRSHLHHLPGWTGFIKWREGEPGYPMQERHPIDLVSYLAVRLFYESELVDRACREKWGIEGILSQIQSHINENPEDPGVSSGNEKKEEYSDPVSGDAWRLFQLAQFLEISTEDFQRAAGPEIRALLELLDGFPAEEQGPVWLTALERSYRDLLISELREIRTGGEKVQTKRPPAQALFCIDARSEGLRRNLESRGPYETFGIAGFFGVPLCYRPYRGEEDYLLCPVLFKPERRAAEHPRAGQEGAARSFETAGEWGAAGHELFHDLKANNLSAFPVIDFFSPGFGLRLFGRSLFPALEDRWRGRLKGLFPPEPQTEIRFDRPGEEGGRGETSAGLPSDFGFNSEEQCGLVENALRMVGLTRNFSRLILFCAHGSRTENNPYAAAYDCGACGGRHGGPNARALSRMANRPEVREGLTRRGIEIPKDTFFIAGEHNTATDEVVLFDRADIPESHKEDLASLFSDLKQAGQRQALERLGRIPGAPGGLSPAGAQAHARKRSGDWAEIRPEWGLSRNAAFIIGRRSLSRGINLEGRVFLNSYNPEFDDSGKALEAIMTGPLVVVQTICMEYYFSSTDPWNYGGGSKVLHNVAAGVGVMFGRQSDLAAGLPMQSVSHGRMIYHEPMRPLVVIEAPGRRVLDIIRRHPVLSNFMDHEWVRLVVLDPSEGSFSEYRPGGLLEPVFSPEGEAS